MRALPPAPISDRAASASRICSSTAAAQPAGWALVQMKPRIRGVTTSRGTLDLLDGILAIHFGLPATDCRLPTTDRLSYRLCSRRAKAISALTAWIARRDSRIKKRQPKKRTKVPAKPSAVGIHAANLTKKKRPIAIVVATKIERA